MFGSAARRPRLLSASPYSAALKARTAARRARVEAAGRSALGTAPQSLPSLPSSAASRYCGLALCTVVCTAVLQPPELARADQQSRPRQRSLHHRQADPADAGQAGDGRDPGDGRQADPSRHPRGGPEEGGTGALRLPQIPGTPVKHLLEVIDLPKLLLCIYIIL